MLVVQLSPSWVVLVSRQASTTLDLRRLLLPARLRQPSLVARHLPNLQLIIPFGIIQYETQAPSQEGAFLFSLYGMFDMAAFQTPAQPTLLPAWEQLYYDGDRLRAEVSLLGAAVAGHLQPMSWCRLCPDSSQPWCCHCTRDIECLCCLSTVLNLKPSSPEEAWKQLLPVADLPDALLFWAFIDACQPLLMQSQFSGFCLLQRLAMLLYQQRPGRPDLPYQVLMREATGSLLKTAPKQWLKPGHWYSRPEAYLPQLQVAWVQGRYEAMWLGCLRGQLDGRYFPLSDHHIRGLSVIGEAERCLQLFQQLYNCNPAEFQLGSVSNMLFMALGSEQLPQTFITTLASHFHQLSSQAFSSLSLPAVASCSKTFSVQEKPCLVVVSSDLRQHPVGRFWLPIARHLRPQFRCNQCGWSPPRPGSDP